MAEAPERTLAPHRRRTTGRRILLPGAGLVLGLLLICLLAGNGMAWSPFGADGKPAGGAPAAAPSAQGPAARAGDLTPRPQHVTGKELPFDLPSPATLRTGHHLVFAHYFTPYPLSLDNKPAGQDYYSRNYLTAQGENGKHAPYGGLLRDRPLPVAPRGGDWQLANLQQEVRTARAAGIDGFSVDILSLTGPNWERVNLLLKAAASAAPGFRIMLMPDMTSLHTDPTTLADALAGLAASPAAHRLGDGRLVISPFKAEAHSPGWWSQLTTRLRIQHGIRTALVPLFLDFTANAERFAPISYGFSEWGNRSYTAQAGAASDVALAHRLGKTWMQPVSVQDARPNQGVYDEAGNTATLRAGWGHAIDDGADWVQLTTWNDYSEGSQFAPSLHNGYVYLDLSSYYLTRFKTGQWPRIVRDTVYLTSRVQFAGTRPLPGAQQKLMSPRAGTAAPRDTVEALTFLTAPAVLDTVVGTERQSHPVPAGVRPTLVPLHTGWSAATVRRDGRTVAEVTSRHPVRSQVQVQDLQYYAESSGRPDTP
ncbi:endo-1,3-alpha-glucanase family glycosylhydrolase [Streptomyces sp. NBC_00963]|uniref:glycoside hydrolase family 71 protein n=1 Tax=Streptomyces sp. NBC_00963 TaxID=2903697 RepID=UPI003870BFC0|nr:endo-1,3-alpha-glucanase family glycosylhydrolase [Streptomyces sp. NBC_00963]